MCLGVGSWPVSVMPVAPTSYATSDAGLLPRYLTEVLF